MSPGDDGRRRRFPPAGILLAGLLLAVAACTRGGPQVPASPADPTVNETRPRANQAYGPAFEGQTRAPRVVSPFALDVRTVARGLRSPWGLAFLPDGRALVTERGGRLRILSADGDLSSPLEGLPPVAAEGQGGLLDVAVDPRFAENRRIYWTYAEPRDGATGTTLASAVLAGDDGRPRLEDVRVLFRQLPAYPSDAHYGSRIVFAPDGTLFVTLGERQAEAARVQAQRLDGHLGKVVRIRPDGSVPEDNPFVAQPGARPEIWSLGHRNVQAAALDPAGRLWTVEHGPRGGDELNQPEPGKNYGWPVIGYGIDYSGAALHAAGAQPGMEQPVYYWDPVIAPSGAVFYSGRLATAWQGNLFVGGLGSQKLVRLVLDGDRVVGEEWLLGDRGLRIRDVQEGPDGALYLLVEDFFASVLRVAPAVAP